MSPALSKKMPKPGGGVSVYKKGSGKKYVSTSDVGYGVAAEGAGELELSVSARGDEVGGLEAVGCFGRPLLLFAEAPQDEDAGEDDCKG